MSGCRIPLMHDVHTQGKRNARRVSTAGRSLLSVSSMDGGVDADRKRREAAVSEAPREGNLMRSAEQYLDGLHDGREVYYRGERVADVVEHPELGLAARHGALDFHGPSPEPSPYYTIPRSAADLLARSALIEDSTRRGRTLVVLIKEIGTDALFALHRVMHGTDAYARVAA